MRKRIGLFVMCLVLLLTACQFPMNTDTKAAEGEENAVALQEEGNDDSSQNEESLPVYETGVYKVDGQLLYYDGGEFPETEGEVTQVENVTGIVKRTSDGKKVYVKNSKFKASTGIAKYLADGRWLYVVNGIFTKKTGVAKRITDKKWLFVKNGIYKKSTGAAYRFKDKKWVYVKNGVFKKYTGLVKKLTDKKWIFVKNGVETKKLSNFVLTDRDQKAGYMKHYVEAYAKAVASKIVKPGMTQAQRTKAAFNYTINNFQSTANPRIPHYTGTDWIYIYAYDMFGPRGGGNCISFGAAFAFIAKACGCKKVYACNSGYHGWTEVNGLVYDPEQYHDTNDRKIYAKSYSDSMVSGYWSAISDYKTNKFKRMKINEF